jgi:hypothetical protein
MTPSLGSHNLGTEMQLALDCTVNVLALQQCAHAAQSTACMRCTTASYHTQFTAVQQYMYKTTSPVELFLNASGLPGELQQ